MFLNIQFETIIRQGCNHLYSNDTLRSSGSQIGNSTQHMPILSINARITHSTSRYSTNYGKQADKCFAGNVTCQAGLLEYRSPHKLILSTFLPTLVQLPLGYSKIRLLQASVPVYHITTARMWIKYDLNEFGSDMTILSLVSNTTPTPAPRVIHIPHDQVVTINIPDNQSLNLMIEHQADRKELIVLLVNDSNALVGRVSIYKERDPTYWGEKFKTTLEDQLIWHTDLKHCKFFVWEPKEQDPEDFTTKFLQPWAEAWNLHPIRDIYHLEADKIMTAMEFNKHEAPIKPFLKITRTLDSWTNCGVDSKTLWRSDYSSRL